MTIQTIHRHPCPPFTPQYMCHDAWQLSATIQRRWAMPFIIQIIIMICGVFWVLVFLMMLSDLLIARVKPLIKMLLGNFWLRRASPSATQPNGWSAKRQHFWSVLQGVTPADIERRSSSLPRCHAFITTGKKRLKFMSTIYKPKIPNIGEQYSSWLPTVAWFISLTIITHGRTFGDW